MDMKWKKLAAMGCIVTMTAVLTIGCGTTESTSSTSADSMKVTEEQESDAVTMQVTSVDGDTVTGNVGEMSEAPSGDRAPEDGNSQQPAGQAPGGAPQGQGGFGGSSEVTNGTSANTMDEDTSVDGETYSSTGDDENALRVDGATVTLSNISVEKTAGSSSNTEDGDWYGQNAGLLALNGATVNITGATVNTSVQNGNGVFSYGEGTTVNISDSTIRTTENNSGGIHTTGGGTMNADNLDVETSGNSAAAIRSDRGGGDVNVTGGTYTTNGTGSPAIYCTADISVEDAELTANASEGVVVEGKNSVSLKNCNLVSSMDNTYNGDSSENIHGIMIYQSMSGDAESGTASFSSVDGSITAKKGDLFYVTNTDCEIYL